MLERFAKSRGRARVRSIARFTGGIAAAAFALAIAVPAAAPAASVTAFAARTEPGPAMWVVQDADTTIYLFGTFHALDSRTSWFSSSVRAAFESSEALVLETLVPENPAELHSTIARNSMSTDVKPGDPVIGSERAPSYVASAGQAMSAGRSMGISVEHGADAVLRRAANATGKRVEGLETFEYQLRMFASLPPAPPMKGSPQGANGLAGYIDDMQSAWRRGDNDRFAAILNTVRSQSPQTYKTLFVDRNANWAAWIANRMTQPGTVFVAVGTGHLVGPESVQEHLAARGIKSAKVS